MSGTDDLIDFDVIEAHKENIQALPSGRSAKALAQLYSPPITLGQTPSPLLTNDVNDKRRAEFEQELANIDEADDPLDVFDRYVKWTLEAYPSAQSTPQSRLLPLLEQATKTFQSEKHYKNDVRYLKLWLHYIRFFSDAPRETFVYLSRHGIGEHLALYYEEFAAWLEHVGRWNQAEELYRLGIEKEATPQARLIRKFGEFERRKAARPENIDEPSSPALPTVRPALAAKIDPFATGSPEIAQQMAKSAVVKKSKGSKMQIFSDVDAPDSRPGSGSSSQGWDNIGSLADRKKENTREVKSWTGEKLQTGKTNGGMGKMTVFKDQSQSLLRLPHHLTSRRSQQIADQDKCVPNAKTGRLECVFVDLESVYPDEKDRPEFCFEELMAKRRGWLSVDWRAEAVTASPTVHQNDCSLEELPDGLHETERTSESRENLEDDWQKVRLIDTKKGDMRALPEHTGDDHVLLVREQQSITHDDNAVIHAGELRSKNGANFKIFEDGDKQPDSELRSDRDDLVLVETHVRTITLNDQNDENSPPSQQELDLAKQLRRDARQNRTRKIKVMDVKHVHNETKTIQLNMDSPAKTNKTVKRKKIADPTITINTKEAIEEIYGIFNQPLDIQVETGADSDQDSDDESTTDAESTGTGKISAVESEYGEETRNEIFQSSREREGQIEPEDDQTEGSGWSDFTTSKNGYGQEQTDTDETQNTAGVHSYRQLDLDREQLPEDASPPIDEGPRTRYMPVLPEGVEPPTHAYRDAVVTANNRLPFMTPIVEQTESSIGAATGKTEDSYYNQQAKTPSRRAECSAQALLDDDNDDDEPCSSPFPDESPKQTEQRRKVLLPIRTKSTKGTISLGHGTAKAQTDAKAHLAIKSSALPESQQRGAIIEDPQCNPMDINVRRTILAQMKPSLHSYEGYHEDLNNPFGKSADIRRYLSKSSKKTKETGEKTAPSCLLPPTLNLPGADGEYVVRRELGAGTYAPVYLVENITALSVEGGEEERQTGRELGKAAHRKPLEAIKVEDPPSTWEFYIIRQCHRRLGVSRAAESMVRAHEMHLFRDEGFLVEEYRDQGTLLDLVNIAKHDTGSTGGMEESLAMFFTVELLRSVEAMHSKQLIHGDLKGDNVLVRFDDPGLETDWSPIYFPSGAHGWSSKGICLIDFGRGIDMKQFMPNIGFIADWKTNESDCSEMRELRPWTYQIDYHGLAGIIHTCLFGKYMETVAEQGGGLGQGATKTYRIREGLKRYWQVDIWNEIFTLLLNPLAHLDCEEGRKLPITKGMRHVREKMEGWLEENCERGVGLKGTIAKMEAVLRDRRKKSAK